MPKRNRITPDPVVTITMSAAQHRGLLAAEREASKLRGLRQLHPLSAAKSVIGFEEELNKHLQLNYANLLKRGVLVRDVRDSGNRDARLSAAATALSFISSEEINTPEFAEVCQRLNGFTVKAMEGQI
jgi:hypothetical protein